MVPHTCPLQLHGRVRWLLISSSSSSSLFPIISPSSTTVLLFFSKTPLDLVQLLLAVCFFIANTNRPNIIFIWSFSTSNYGKSKNCLQWRSRSGGYLLSRNATAAGVPPSPSSRAAFTSSLSTEAFQEDTSSRVLEGLDPVKKRPGMYIGSTRLRGLHHLVYEILDNAIDEAQAGFASVMNVVIHADNSMSITNNGRGIPTDLHPTTKKSSLETVLTKYSRGKPVTTLTCHVLPAESRARRETQIRFWPDKEVFITSIEFDYNTIASRSRELAFLNPKLTISLSKGDNNQEKMQHSEF